MTDGSTVYLRTEVVDSLTNMIAAAAQAGVQIYAVSGLRTYDRQKNIWERRLNLILSKRAKRSQTKGKLLKACKKLLKYSLPPGLTRHHWGTEVDLVTTESRYWRTRRGKRQIKWLAANSARYGFYMVYDKGRSKGVSYEPWHWSFAPLAKPLMGYYLKHVKTADLGDFLGSECLAQIDWKAQLLKAVNGK